MSDIPKTFQHCIRCDKDVTHEPIHTCTPSKRYRAGMEEGRKELQAKYERCITFLEGMAYFSDGDYNGLRIEWAHDAKQLLKELNDELP